MSIRKITGWFRAAVVLGLTLALNSAVLGAEVASQQEMARQILDRTGIQGGLLVHLGCGDGKLTAALRANDSYLVHGLDTDAANIESARKYIRALGLYGKVSVDRLSNNRLPYTDNLVNLLVSESLNGVSMDEMMRVLVPNGVAYFKEDGQWMKATKPRSKETDEWTHYLHDSTGNAVAHDSVVGPPRHLQWIGSPRWSRHHDRMASMSALVSTGGRIFYIFDEGSTESIQLLPKRFLIARDAYNGTILWKRPITTWHSHLFPYKSGPAQLPRRLVAVGERVYVTLGLHAPLTALDAATGEIVRTYSGSRATEEVIAADGTLFLLVDEAPPADNEYIPEFRCMHDARNTVARVRIWDERDRRILAVEAASGKVLWNNEQQVVPLTLTAQEERVFFHDGEKIVCLDRQSGDELWSSAPVSMKSTIPSNFGPTLVAYQDVVLFSGGDRSMTALAAETGKTLWTSHHPPSGHHSPEDLLVVGGLVWSGAIAGGKDSGMLTGRDLLTGEIKSQFPPDVDTYWFHHRCYRSKATDRFLLTSRTGIEFVDFESNHWDTNHWVRGGCIYGIMPCNGLVYAPPHSCACYIDAKLSGFCALAPQRKSRVQSLSNAERGLRIAESESRDIDRLERGPAYGKIPQSAFRIRKFRIQKIGRLIGMMGCVAGGRARSLLRT